jgi:hypothetical protein
MSSIIAVVDSALIFPSGCAQEWVEEGWSLQPINKNKEANKQRNNMGNILSEFATHFKSF